MTGPSKIDILLASAPKDLQVEGLEVIIKEHNRFARKEYTQEEKEMSETCRLLGETAAETTASQAIKILEDPTHGN